VARESAKVKNTHARSLAQAVRRSHRSLSEAELRPGSLGCLIGPSH
jgi:hypothetical protein